MLPTVPLLRAGGVYNSLDVQDITPAQGGEVVAKITMSNSGLIKRDLLDLKKSRESFCVPGAQNVGPGPTWRPKRRSRANLARQAVLEEEPPKDEDVRVST